MNQQGASNNGFNFSAQPQVVRQPKSKYRAQPEEEEQRLGYTNLMNDKRVVRGNTYAPIVTSKNTDTYNEIRVKQPTRRPPQLAQPQQQDINQHQFGVEPGTPPPVVGRQHQELQTDEFVETLTDKPPQYQVETQTDFYIDRPVVRLFMPKKTGLDRETQIWDGDLFDFDYEVDPILQVLIGKTLEQSRMEVHEEEELRVMKETQKRFEQLRNQELNEMQRCEAKEQRLHEESERRKLQYKKKRDQDVFSHQKMISRVMAKQYLNKLRPRVVNVLEDQGVFRNPLEMSLYDRLVPWLYNEVLNILQKKDAVEREISTTSNQVIHDSCNIHGNALKKEQERRDAIKKQRAEEAAIAEDKRLQKEEAKRKRREFRRRDKLIEQAKATLQNAGTQLPNIFAAKISDIDGCQRETPFVGLFGGVIGEVILFLNCLEKLSQQEGATGLADYATNPENAAALVDAVITYLTNNGAEEIQFGVSEALDQAITAFDEQFNLSNWHNATTNLPEIKQIVASHLTSQITNTLQRERSAPLVEKAVKQLLDIYEKVDEQREKIKFLPTTQKDSFKREGICYMQPELATLSIHPTSNRAGTYMPQDDPEQAPQLCTPASIAESEFEPRGTVFAASNGTFEVLVQHPVAELSLYNELIGIVTSQVKSLEEQQPIELLQKIHDIMREQQVEVLRKIVPGYAYDYPVLDMRSY